MKIRLFSIFIHIVRMLEIDNRKQNKLFCRKIFLRYSLRGNNLSLVDFENKVFKRLFTKEALSQRNKFVFSFS